MIHLAYQARRSDEDEISKERSDQNNKSNIKNAADIAIASKNPYAVAAGGAIKVADKLTGDQASSQLGKMVTKANQSTPGGKKRQDILDRLNESGLPEHLGQAASMYNGLNNHTNQSSKNSGRRNKSSENRKDGLDSSNNNDQDLNSTGSGSGSIAKKIAIASIGVVIALIFPLIIIISVITPYSDFEDALGASYASGEETGSFTDFKAVTEEAQDFYERINEVKLEFAKEEKALEAVRVVAVYHIMSSENNNFTYRNMTKARIRQIANAMFKENEYDEQTFKENLTNSIFKKNFPTYDQKKRTSMTNRVIKYIEDYYSFLGVDQNTCSNIGTCSYQIKGYYYPTSKGNYYLKPTLEFNNLKVRLMQAGFTSNPSNGKSLEGEELIPFEQYILGLAYFQMDSSMPDEAIKAFFVTLRSFTLARSYNMKGAKTLNQEQDGKWILQVSNTTSDQAFCNPDLGCSSDNSENGQIYSGHKYYAWQKNALAEDSKLRRLASEVIGEVLVNEEGNIIYTVYNSTTTAKFVELANQGYDYKQILLNVYNNLQPSGAAGVNKTSCTTTGSSTCNSTFSGPYTSWKQYEGSWTNVQVGSSGQSIKSIGCAATSVAILIAKSKVPTTIELNPGNFVTKLNANGGFGTPGCPGCIVWSKASVVAPSFKYAGLTNVSGYSKEAKLNTLKDLLNKGYYVTAEVKGDTGQHWVAIDSIKGKEIIMIDPGSNATNLWQTYPWYNTSRFVYYRVV